VYDAAWEGKPGSVYLSRLEALGEQVFDWAHGRDVKLIDVWAGEMAVFLDYAVARVPLVGGSPRPWLGDVMLGDVSEDGRVATVARNVRETDFDASFEAGAVADVRGRQQIELPPGKPVFSTSGTVAYPRLNPPAGLVAFAHTPSTTAPATAVLTVDATSATRTVSEGWAEISGLAWASGGREIWVSGRRGGGAWGVYALGLSGGERSVMTSESPWMLQDVRADGSLLMSRDLRRTETWSTQEPNETLRNLSWLDRTNMADLSADGRLLLFDEQGEGGGSAGAVYLATLDESRPPVRLGEGRAIALSPDASRALTLVGGSKGDLVLLPTGPGSPQALPRGRVEAYLYEDWFPGGCWLPNGNAVLFVAKEKDRPRRIFVQQVPSGEPRPLTPEGTLLIANSVSRDGRFLAAYADASGRFGLYPLGDGSFQPIPHLGAAEEVLAWSTSGDEMIIRDHNGPRLPVILSRYDVAAHRKRPWRTVQPADSAGVVEIGRMRVASGDRLVYSFDRHLSDLFLVSGVSGH
jgi:hypothetical protein